MALTILIDREKSMNYSKTKDTKRILAANEIESDTFSKSGDTHERKFKIPRAVSPWYGVQG